MQLDQALAELDQIRNTRQSITDPDGLKAVERAVLQATDKIAALMTTGLKIQQAVDSDELGEKPTDSRNGATTQRDLPFPAAAFRCAVAPLRD